MNVLIIYAHPEPRSFNAAMRDLAVTTLTQMGHQVEVSDLYAMQFNPIAGPGDFLERADSEHLSLLREQRYAAGGPGFAPEIAAEHAKIRRADLIIFQFPLWWRSMPAMMKGYVDRVFAQGVIYGRGVSLADKKGMLALTTGGPVTEEERPEADAWLAGQLVPLEDGIIRYVGMELWPRFVAWGPAGVDQTKREEMLRQYRQHLMTVQGMRSHVEASGTVSFSRSS